MSDERTDGRNVIRVRRVFGFLVCLVVSLMALVSTQAAPTPAIAYTLLLIPVVPWLGYLLAWMHPRAGGAVMMLGAVAGAVAVYFAAVFDEQPWITAIMFFAAPFFAAGLFFFVVDPRRSARR